MFTVLHPCNVHTIINHQISDISGCRRNQKVTVAWNTPSTVFSKLSMNSQPRCNGFHPNSHAEILHRKPDNQVDHMSLLRRNYKVVLHSRSIPSMDSRNLFDNVSTNCISHDNNNIRQY